MTATFRLACFALLLSPVAFLGCAQRSTHPAAMNAVELLDILEDDLKKHDPTSYVENQIGKFKITHVVRDTQRPISVTFDLYAVLPDKKLEDFKASQTDYEQRIRDSVIAIIQFAETEQLLDPSLASLKEEVTSSINRVTKKRLVKDVVFSEFAVEST